MKQIAEGLWQTGTLHEERIPINDVDVVFWMCGQAPPAPFGKILIDYPIPDDPDGLPKEVFQDLWALACALRDKNILTVCNAGENRSGLVSVLVLLARGLNVERAISIVQENGPRYSADKEHAFWNPGFVRQVREAFGDE